MRSGDRDELLQPPAAANTRRRAGGGVSMTTALLITPARVRMFVSIMLGLAPVQTQAPASGIARNKYLGVAPMQFTDARGAVWS